MYEISIMSSSSILLKWRKKYLIYILVREKASLALEYNFLPADHMYLNLTHDNIGVLSKELKFGVPTSL